MTHLPAGKQGLSIGYADKKSAQNEEHRLNHFLKFV
jgi:hypothetical protein